MSGVQCLVTWWWKGIDFFDSRLADRRHAPNIRLYAIGMSMVFGLLFGLQWAAGERHDLDELYRPGWSRVLLWCLGATITWSMAVAIWGRFVAAQRSPHPCAVQMVLIPSMVVLSAFAAGHGMHDTPVPMLMLNVLVFSRWLFTWSEVKWAWGLSVMLVLVVECLTIMGHMPYAPLLVEPVYTGGALHPWWAMWVRVLFVLASVLMSLVLLCLAVAVRRRGIALEALARTDELTGLANRRELMSRLKTEGQRQARNGRPLAIALFDVDHFKQVNDRWGHPAGDEVLTRIGGLLKAHSRDQVDFAARYGGEEFVLLLPEAGLQEASEVAQRVCARLRQERFQVDGHEFGVTQSVGIAEVVNGDTDGALRRADFNLYAAKQEGRNRIVAR